MLRNSSLTLCTILALNLSFIACTPNKYTSPKSQLETLMLGQANIILKNTAVDLHETNLKRLQGIKVYLNKERFSVSSNFSNKKLLLPAQDNLTPIAAMAQEAYLDLLCADDKDCQVKLINYNSVYILLHELHHMLHATKHDEKRPNTFVKDPKGSRKIMSFDEEIKAESVVVKYLSIYEPSRLAEYKALFSKILTEKGFKMDPDEIKQNWDSFNIGDFRQVNHAKLYFFLYAAEHMDESSLEELLFN